jgi:hypothetical protein
MAQTRACAVVLVLVALLEASGATSKFKDSLAFGEDGVAVLFNGTVVRNGSLRAPVASLLPPSMSSPSRIQQLLLRDRDLGVSRNRSALVYSCSMLVEGPSAGGGNRTTGRRMLGGLHGDHSSHAHHHGHHHGHAHPHAGAHRRLKQLIQANLQVA